MTNMPMPRPRWAIAATARNEIECQRIRQWLERRGIAVRVQSVIVAKNREEGAQLKVFVPSGELRRAQTIIKEKQHHSNLAKGGRTWPSIKENGRLIFTIAIIVAITLGCLWLKTW